MNQRWIVFLSAVLATSIIATGFGLAVDRAVGTTASTPHLRTVPSATLASQGVSRSPYSVPAYCGLEQAAVSRGGLTNPKLACPLSPAAAAAAATRAEGGHPVESLLARISTGPPTSLHAHPVWLVVVGGGTLAMSVRVVVLKPVFGALADRVGPRPVLLGGLLAFVLASLAFTAAGNPGFLAAARLAQGMSAAAFSPAAGALALVRSGTTG